MIRISLLMSLVLFSAAAFAEDSIPDHLLKQNGKCEKEASVTHCRIHVANYSQTIHVFIPNALAEAKQAPFLLHLHGHNGDLSAEKAHFAKPTGEFAKWLDPSVPPVILVAPESEGKCATYDTELNTAVSVETLLTNIQAAMNIKLTKLAITVHSGAYRTLARIAGWKQKSPETFLKSLGAVGIFDAVYGRVKELAQLANLMKSQKSLFWVLYADPGSTVIEEKKLNKELETEPQAWTSKAQGETGIHIRKVSDVKHENMLMEGRFASFIKAWNP